MWGCSRWPECDGAINIDPPESAITPLTDETASTSLVRSGTPGAYAQRRADRERERARLKRRAALPLIVGTAVIVMWGTYLSLLTFGAPIAGSGAVLVGSGFAFALFRLPFESLVWARGVEGEQRAAAYLEPLLDAGYVVLYNRMIPGIKADIDALVIGPTGIFTIETKNWSGKLDVRHDRLFVGEHDRTWVIRQVYREALAVQMALAEELAKERLTVTPILCAIGGVASGQKVASGVQVTSGPRLADVLTRGSQVLDDERVQELVRAADRSLRAPYSWE
jgi:hypothetical protein